MLFFINLSVGMTLVVRICDLYKRPWFETINAKQILSYFIHIMSIIGNRFLDKPSNNMNTVRLNYIEDYAYYIGKCEHEENCLIHILYVLYSYLG